MTNFLCVINNETHHYFYDNTRGICRRICRGGIWGVCDTVYREGADGFGVYADHGGNVHLLCTNKTHEMIYLLCKNNTWHQCTITKNRAEVTPLTFRIGTAQGRLQLFCSARYQESIILIHAVLGVNAMPATIDTLQSDDYVLHGTKVYYTNADGVFGYQDFSDGKPAQFIPLYQEGVQGYVCDDGIVWLNNHMLMLGENEVYEDTYGQYPILLRSGDKLMLMWQSNEFVRYMTSADNGSTWNGPMRFVSTGHEVQRYLLQNGDEHSCLYGTHTDRELRIFGKTDLTERTTSVRRQNENDNGNMELQKLRIMIEMMRAETMQLKKQMKDLHTILENMKNGEHPAETK